MAYDLVNGCLAIPVGLVLQTKSMDCWLAGAQMLAAYKDRQIALANWMQTKYDQNGGLSKNDRKRLCRDLGMSPVPGVGYFTKITTGMIQGWLRAHGPIWCAMGRWEGVRTADGKPQKVPDYGHVIVIYGAQDTFVHFRDPENLAGDPFANETKNHDRMSLTWFNDRRSKFSHALLYLPGGNA